MLKSGDDAKILFLDIDTVLNGEIAMGDYPHPRKPFIQKNLPLCRENLHALRAVLDLYDDLGIVLTTDWIYFDSNMYYQWQNPLKWLMKQEWFAHHVIGWTPRKMSSSQREEIYFWLRQNEYNKKNRKCEFAKKRPDEYKWFNVKNFVILTSPLRSMDWYGDHYIKTSGEAGLTYEDAKHIAVYLKYDNYRRSDWWPQLSKRVTSKTGD